jgi:Starter unit:ACP transacylase in aflatoxin biosynthesis
MACRKEDTLRLIYFSNELPHDDLQTLLRRLHNHAKDKRHRNLAQFLEEATSAVRDEVRKLPLETRRLVPSFESMHTLAADEKLRRGRLCGSIDGVLLCVVQLGFFIG